MGNKIQNIHYEAIVQDTLASIETGVVENASAFRIKDEVQYILDDTERLNEDTKKEEQRVLLKAVTEQLQYTHKISKDIHRLLSKSAIAFHSN